MEAPNQSEHLNSEFTEPTSRSHSWKRWCQRSIVIIKHEKFEGWHMTVMVKLKRVLRSLEMDLKYVYFTHLYILHFFLVVSSNLQLEDSI